MGNSPGPARIPHQDGPSPLAQTPLNVRAGALASPSVVGRSTHQPPSVAAPGGRGRAVPLGPAMTSTLPPEVPKRRILELLHLSPRALDRLLGGNPRRPLTLERAAAALAELDEDEREPKP